MASLHTQKTNYAQLVVPAVQKVTAQLTEGQDSLNSCSYNSRNRPTYLCLNYRLFLSPLADAFRVSEAVGTAGFLTIQLMFLVICLCIHLKILQPKRKGRITFALG